MPKFAIGDRIQTLGRDQFVGVVESIHEGEGAGGETAYGLRLQNPEMFDASRAESELEPANYREQQLAQELFALLVAIKSHYEGDEQDLDVAANIIAERFGWRDIIDGPATLQERAENHGCYIGHDLHGWYVADLSEQERDETGPSVGFDGRKHFETEEAAADALEQSPETVMKAD